MSVRIEIDEVVDSGTDMVDLLNHIATKIKEGFTSGYHPGWTLFDAVKNPTAPGAEKKT